MLPGLQPPYLHVICNRRQGQQKTAQPSQPSLNHLPHSVRPTSGVFNVEHKCDSCLLESHTIATCRILQNNCHARTMPDIRISLQSARFSLSSHKSRDIKPMPPLPKASRYNYHQPPQLQLGSVPQGRFPGVPRFTKDGGELSGHLQPVNKHRVFPPHLAPP